MNVKKSSHNTKTKTKEKLEETDMTKSDKRRSRKTSPYNQMTQVTQDESFLPNGSTFPFQSAMSYPLPQVTLYQRTMKSVTKNWWPINICIIN